jgi:hypothetical protein
LLVLFFLDWREQRTSADPAQKVDSQSLLPPSRRRNE